MKSPLVSVLMPCFNAAPFLGAAVESVLSQDYENLELIIVDDGSTDGSAGVISCYSDARVRVISQANAGQCAAANVALQNCAGEFVKFFDADDILGPSVISKQMIAMGGRQDVVAFCEWDRFYGDDLSRASFPQRSMYQSGHPVDWLAREWLGARPMMQCGLWLIPRPVLDRSGAWDERLSLINDFEFFARVLLSSSELRFSPGARLFYRSGVGGSLSSRTSRKAVESAFLSISLGTQHLLDAENSLRTRRACADLFADFDFTYFPHHSDLRRVARTRRDALGGSSLEPEGPPRFHALRRLVGWRSARLAQIAFQFRRRRAGPKGRSND